MVPSVGIKLSGEIAAVVESEARDSRKKVQEPHVEGLAQVAEFMFQWEAKPLKLCVQPAGTPTAA